MEYKLYNNDSLVQLDLLEENSIDSIVTDPPYELNFMGKGWDNAGISFNPEIWQKCYRVLKTGGYLLAFGGSRTFHRIACAIEDAGFEIRDTIIWLYGSGFPKSMALDKAIEGKLTTGSANKTEFHKLNGVQEDKHHYGFTTSNKEQGFRPKDYTTEGASDQWLKELDATTELAKQYKGWGTALKPSFEPVIVARKPFKGSLVDNVIENGVGGINIDECRVGTEVIKGGTMPKMNATSDGINIYNFGKKDAERLEREDSVGRFPANTILTYDETDFDEVCGGFPNTKTGWKNTDVTRTTDNITVDFANKVGYTGNHYNDSGSACRYFYCAKASKKDRDEGLDDFEEKTAGELTERKEGSAGITAFTGSRVPKRNSHPTVKPTELMQYLVRLVTPKGGTILDPFMGSGSTGKAVAYENKERKSNYKFIGIEREKEYCEIAKARIKYASDQENTDEQISIIDLE